MTFYKIHTLEVLNLALPVCCQYPLIINYPELDDTDVEHLETENHRFQELEVNVELVEDLVVETEEVNLNVESSISLHCFA